MSPKNQIKEPDNHSENDDYAIHVSCVSKSYVTNVTPANRLKSLLFGSITESSTNSETSLNSFQALQDVTFSVRKGETLGIIGRNGSGKSTLLQIICGTLHPNKGTVDISGRVAALLELGSGFNNEFTGRENVLMNGMMLGLSKKEIAEKFDAIHTFSGIGTFIDQPVKTYSSGMMVRLAFAVIAHVDADILVIDEALSVGDVFFVQKCMRFLRKFMKTGTLLFVSHDTGSVVNLCDKAIWLEAGKVVLEGNPKQISEAYLAKQYELEEQVDDGLESPTYQLNVKQDRPPKRPVFFRDMRADLINTSNLRNDLELFTFDENASGFGIGGIFVEHAQINNENGAPLNWVVGGEIVQLVITAHSIIRAEKPIVGFVVRDRLGQPLFGDNTYLTYKDKYLLVEPSQSLQATFVFQMPIMPLGDYTISLAFANGTQDDHIIHSWKHDVITFKSHSSSITTGLLGIPMLDIKIDILEI